MVGICFATTSSIAITSAYCRSPPDTLDDWTWDKLVHAVTRRIEPVLVSVG